MVWIEVGSLWEEDVLTEYDRLRKIIAGIEIPPLPEHFNALGHNTPVSDLEILCALVELVRDYTDKPIGYLEVGSWAGSSALAVASRPNVEVHCVDHWKGADGPEGEAHRETARDNGGDVFSIFQKNTAEYNITPHRGTSLDWAEAASQGKFWYDIIFLDSDHRYEHIKADIEAWLPHIREGGILCGHDYNFEGVQKAVKELGHDASVGAVWYKRVHAVDKMRMESKLPSSLDARRDFDRLGKLRTTIKLDLLPDSFESLGMTTPRNDLITLASLVELVKDGHRRVVYLEVGSWTGSSTLAVASLPNVEIHCVDHWEGQTDPEDYLSKLMVRDQITSEQAYQTWRRNVAGSRAMIRAYRSCSTSVAATWQKKLDIVFLDGGHLEEEVEADIDAWLPHICSGGILCGHDYSFSGVQKVVNRLLPDAVIGDIWYKRIRTNQWQQTQQSRT